MEWNPDHLAPALGSRYLHRTNFAQSRPVLLRGMHWLPVHRVADLCARAGSSN
jgi:hypothetical protein